MLKQKIKRSIALDTALLIFILAAGNQLFSPSDPGWLSLNPTPYLLVPVLIGIRYGFAGGLTVGLTGSAITFLLIMMQCSLSVADIFKTHTYYLFSLPLAGAMTGELSRLMRKKCLELSELKNVLETRQKRLEQDLDLSRESQHELQLQLAFHGAELCCLEYELQRLFRPAAGPLLPGVLSLLHNLTGLTDAAFYSRVHDQKLLREAFIGDPCAFPETLTERDADIAWASVTSAELTTCRDFIEADQSQHSNYLAALPLKDLDNKVISVLLIYGMPFLSVTWQNFSRIELICSWVMTTAAFKKQQGACEAAPGMVSPEHFRHGLELACYSAARHSLPSTALYFGPLHGVKVSPENILNRIAPLLRSADMVSRPDQGSTGIAVLFPLVSEREAYERVSKILAPEGSEGSITCRQVPITRLSDPKKLLMQLQGQ
jgi:hypothetical protein